MTNKNKTLNDLREHFPLAGDSYLDALALGGKLPECTYPSNGVPELRDDFQPVKFEDRYAIGNKKG